MSPKQRRVPPSPLIHFTGRQDTLFSILRYGLFYLHNETGILGEIFGGRMLPESAVPTGGMICFTDLQLGHTTTHQQGYGSYGIAVKRTWAARFGARKVTYADSHVINGLREAILRTAPAEIDEFTLGEHPVMNLVHSMAISNPGLLNPEAPPSGRRYRELLSEIMWMQRDADQAESEWRIRHPRTVALLAFGASRADQIQVRIDHLEGIVGRGPEAEALKFVPAADKADLAMSLALRIKPQGIQFICAPEPEVREVREKLLSFRNLWGDRLHDVRVVSSSAHP